MRLWLPLSLLPAILSAQHVPDPFRYVPENAIGVMRMQGGAALQRSLGATSIGKVFAEPDVRKAILDLWRALPDEFDWDGEELRATETVLTAFGDFGGEVVACAVLTPRTADEASDRPFDITVSLQLLGTEAERSSLSDVVRKLLTGDGTELQVLGESFRMHGLANGQISEPKQHDGATVMFWSTGADAGIAHCIAPRTASFALSPALAQSPFGLQLELAAGVDALMVALRSMEDPAAEKTTEKTAEKLVHIMGTLGATSLTRAVWAARADGTWLAQDMELAFRSDQRGLIGGLVPAKVGPPRLLALLPADASSWNTWRFDAEQFYRGLVGVISEVGDQLPATREELEKMFTSATKLRLHEDLIALLGDEWLRIDDLQGAMDPDAPEVDESLSKFQERLGNSVFVVGLRDAAALAKNVETMLRARGLHAARKTEEYAEAKINKLTLLGVLPLEYAFVADVVVVGIGHGEGTRRNLRSVLDAAARQRQQPTAATLSPDMVARMSGWPADAHAFDAASFLEALDGMSTVFDQLKATLGDAELELEPEDLGIAYHAITLGKALRPAVARHGAAVGVTAWWFTKESLIGRSRW